MATATLELSQPEAVIMAAADLELKWRSAFPFEALVMHAWQMFPDLFGLQGFIDKAPDSNKVMVVLVGYRGLVARGWLVKTGQKMYRITFDGRRAARRLR